MANGSRRTTPCGPKAAAVVSEPSVAANDAVFQLKAW